MTGEIEDVVVITYTGETDVVVISFTGEIDEVVPFT